MQAIIDKYRQIAKDMKVQAAELEAFSQALYSLANAFDEAAADLWDADLKARESQPK